MQGIGFPLFWPVVVERVTVFFPLAAGGLFPLAEEIILLPGTDGEPGFFLFDVVCFLAACFFCLPLGFVLDFTISCSSTSERNKVLFNGVSTCYD